MWTLVNQLRGVSQSSFRVLWVDFKPAKAPMCILGHQTGI